MAEVSWDDIPDAWDDIPDAAPPATAPTPREPYEKFLGTEQAKVGAENLRKTTVENLPLAGAMVGGIVAAPTNIVAPGVGEAVGVGGGYLAGKWIKDLITGAETTPGSVTEDVKTGAMVGMLGPTTGKVISKGADVVGNLAKSLWGRLTGTGTAAIEEAVASGTKTGITSTPLKTSTDFDKALRGELTGQQIVDNTKAALQVVKDNRAAAYQSDFAAISQNRTPINMDPIRRKISQLKNQYGIQIGPRGRIDVSRVAMGETGRNDIKDIIKTIDSWGTQPGDNTAVGLDVLKRQLDDFYSESSQARAFVTSLRNTVKDTIVNAVPQYSAMTKDYAEATSMIKDIEAGLMLRKQAMTGRIVADQTLRRLASSMRDNFTLRRDLVNALGEGGSQDLSGQIAGFTMSSLAPHGLAGTGPGMVSLAAALKYLNPKFIPIVAASSPRIAGEFLRLYGKGVVELAGTSGVVGTVGAYEALANSPQPEEPIVPEGETSATEMPNMIPSTTKEQALAKSKGWQRKQK